MQVGAPVIAFMFDSLIDSFGIDENFLKVVFANLNCLLSLRFHPDDLMSFLQPLADVEKYEEWQQGEGQRPEVWQTAVAATEAVHEPIVAFAQRPSVIGLLAGIRLQSATHIAGDKSLESMEEVRPMSLVGGILPHAPTDAGWGDQMGVEAYPKSTAVPPKRRDSLADV